MLLTATLSASALTGCGDDETPLADSYPLEGDTVFPEGVAFDGVNRRFFVGSLTDGSIRAIEADGTQSLFAAAPESSTTTLGLAIDETRRVLWACASPDAQEGADSLWRFDLDSGDALPAVSLATVAEDAQCNDVTLAEDGTAYVTDPLAGAVYRIPTGGPPTLLVDSPMLDAAIAGLGPNGLALTPDGGTLIVARFSLAGLFAIPLDNPEEIRALTLDRPLQGQNALAGPDGLVFLDDTLYVVLDDTVLTVDFNDTLTEGTVQSLSLDGLTGLSTAAVAEGAVYVVKSEVFAQVLGMAPDLPFRIVRVD